MRPARRRNLKPRAESLESRLALTTATLSGGILTVTGTDGNDVIRIGARGPGQLVVRSGGREVGTFDAVSSIAVDAGAGNDDVRVAANVDQPAVLQGGPGNDTLQGGGGPDQLFGGGGNDTLIGSPGGDALVVGSGRPRVVLPRKLGSLAVGPSASGRALMELRQAYTLRPMASPAATAAAGPLIVGPADLADAAVVAQVEAAYEAGDAVGLTRASMADAATLATILGRPDAPTWDPATPRMALVTFRLATRPDGGTDFQTSTLAPVAGSAPGRSLIPALSQVFATQAVTPDTPPDVAAMADVSAQALGGSIPNVLNLANSYTSKALNPEPIGSEQITNSVWAIRSFKNQADFYYVQQETTHNYTGQSRPAAWQIDTNSSIFDGDSQGNVILIGPTPQSNPQTTTATSGISQTVSGSVGFNSGGGVNVSASASVTFSHTSSTPIPPLAITNSSNLATATPSWSYVVSNSARPDGADTIVLPQSWIWEVPFADYELFNVKNKMLNYGFTSGSAYYDPSKGYNPNLSVSAQGTANVPLPFGDTFTLQSPAVTQITAPNTALGYPVVTEGSKFTITGTGLYPALVQNVLIGGTAVDPANITKVSDTEIQVVAPAQFSIFPQSVVVRTTQGTSNTDQSIVIA